VALPRVTMLIQYLYRDEPQLSRFQTGLVFVDDRWKPSLQAFRLPFAQMGRRGLQAIVWGRSATDGRAEDVPARGAPQERVEARRARPADERRRGLHADDPGQARCALPDLVAEPARFSQQLRIR
jgi:hypothetical protein